MNWIKISERKPEVPCILAVNNSGWDLSEPRLTYNDLRFSLGDSLDKYWTHWLPFTPPEPELSEA